MTRCLALSLLSCTLPLGAQVSDRPSGEVQLGLGQSHLRSYTVDAASGSLRVDPKAQTGWTLRGAWVVPLAGPWSAEASLGYRARSSGDLAFRGPTDSGSLDVQQVLERQMILGAALRRTRGSLTAALGLDLRKEDLAAESSGGRSATNLTRPWLRGLVRQDFGAGGLRPCLGLELALPLTRSTPSGADYLSDLDHLDMPPNPASGAVAKTHAPASEVTLTFGLRFSVPR